MVEISPLDQGRYDELLETFDRPRFPKILMSGLGIFLRGLTEDEMKDIAMKQKEIEEISLGVISMSAPQLSLHTNDLQRGAQLSPLMLVALTKKTSPHRFKILTILSGGILRNSQRKGGSVVLILIRNCWIFRSGAMETGFRFRSSSNRSII